MFARIAGVLSLLWLLWLVTSYQRGGFIHILLVLAIVIGLVRLIHGGATPVIAGKENRGLTGSRVATLMIDPDDLAGFEGEGGQVAPETAIPGLVFTGSLPQVRIDSRQRRGQAVSL